MAVKELKYWNGRAQGQWHNKTFNIAAYSKAEANRLMQQVTRNDISYINELNVYYSPCWGNDMKGIEPTEPCIYVTENRRDIPPLRII